MTELINSVLSIFSFGNCMFVLVTGILVGALGASFTTGLLAMAWTAFCMIIIQALWLIFPHFVVLIAIPVFIYISCKKGGDAMVIMNVPVVLIYISHFF